MRTATPLVGVRHSTDPGRIEEAALAIEPEDLALAAQEPAPILETSTQDESPVDDIHAAHLQAEPIAQASIESDIVADDRSASASPLEERHEATEVFDEQPATRVDASREERAPTPVEAAAMEEPRVLVEAATPPAPDEPAQSVTTSVGVEEEAPIEGRYDEAVPNQGAADEVWPAVESSTSASEDGAPSTKRDEVTIAFIVPDNGDRPERTAMSSTQETIGAIRDAEAQLEKPEVEKEEDNEPAVEVKGKPVSGQEEQHEPIVEQPLSPRRIPGSPGRFVEDLPSSARVSRDGARSPTFQLGAAASSASRPSSPETVRLTLRPDEMVQYNICTDQGATHRLITCTRSSAVYWFRSRHANKEDVSSRYGCAEAGQHYSSTQVICRRRSRAQDLYLDSLFHSHHSSHPSDRRTISPSGYRRDFRPLRIYRGRRRCARYKVQRDDRGITKLDER